jgi:hypothetical protein
MWSEASSMNAVRYDRYQMASIRALLRKWGAICEQARNWNGYPSCDTTYRARLGSGYSARLPICEIPSFAVQLSNEVMKLPDDESNAITLWYAHNFNAAGQWMTIEDKALILRVSVDKLRSRERAGRERLMFTAKHIIESWQE